MQHRLIHDDNGHGADRGCAEEVDVDVDGNS
jgi:hypothetical protein